MRFLLKTKVLVVLSVVPMGVTVWDGALKVPSSTTLPVIDSIMRMTFLRLH